MGIAGLLPQLRSITKKAHVSKYRGQTVAVDAYCLLHRGAYTCSRELVEGEPTSRHVAYCMARIELLLGAGVTPLVVFDGGRLPNKADEERSRERNREENKSRARQLWQQGNKAAAMECYQKAVDISPSHAKQFVEALKRRSIKYVVAPYEADAQMAYLAVNGYVDVVLTEDSDLLCYGCPTVFFKMDKNGEGEEVQLEDLPQCKDLAFQGFGHDLFQEMCVLAGCDFVSSLPGIGIKKAHQHLRRTRCFLKVVRSLRFDGTKIPEGYEQRVQRALWTFKHQRVYCPRRHAVVPLHEIADGDLAAGARVPSAMQLASNEPDFLGPALPDDIAQAIAIGDLDPITKLPFGEDLEPATAPLADAGAGSGSDQSAAAAAGLRQAPLGRHQKNGRNSKSGGLKPGPANGGNTLANYKGFLCGLPTQAAAAGFRLPRANSCHAGSQDSSKAAPRQQKEQQQDQVSPPERDSQQRPAPDSPQAVGQPAADAGDTLASPTEEQWASFRREVSRRQRGSSRAMVAGAPAGGVSAKPAVLTTSSFFTAQPGLAGVHRPLGAAVQGGTLLAQLKAALQPEPTIDALLSGDGPSPSSPPAAGSQDGAEGKGRQPRRQMAGGTRARFVVPHRLHQPEQEQQQPKTPLDLGLRSSPTIDDVLGSSGANLREDDQQPVSLAGCQLVQPQASARVWLPQHDVPPLQQKPVELLDLISPAGPTVLQQQQWQQEQQRDEGGITPGFYIAGSSEAGSGARQLTGLLRRLPAVAPSSVSPPRAAQQQQQQLTCTVGGGGSAPLPPIFDPAGPGAVGSADFDPIASLSHVAAFQGEAEAAVERAARSALAAATHKTLRPLSPPPHLQGRGTAASFPSPSSAADSDGGSSDAQWQPPAANVSKRTLLGLAGRVAAEKENRQGLLPVGSKRQKNSSLATNPFASFVFGKS